jgi:O-acetylserine/cysteine efflux transporter
MAIRDFLLLVLVCVVWAGNTVISSIVVAQWHVPPLMYATLRFILVALVTLPYLLPAPRPLWRLILVGLCMGGGNFSLFFLALQTATPSSVAVFSQLGVPITTLLSVLMLGEKIRWKRGLGIVLTLLGALIVIWHPEGITSSHGLLYVIAGCIAGSFGAVMMKQMEGVKPLTLQAWVGMTSIAPLIFGTALFEPGAIQFALGTGWKLLAAVVFSALIVSVVAHTFYYSLIQKYDANLLAPLTLMTPLFSIGMGIFITHDHFDLRMAFGTAIALSGVLIIAIRGNQVMPLLMAVRNRIL